MFKYVALLAVFIPLSAKTHIFIQQEDHLPAYEKHLELQSDPFVVPGRYRMARMDRNEALRSVEHGAPLVFNLFNDVEMRANVQKVKDLANGSRFVSGELAGGGYFTLFFHNSGIIRGELHSIRGTYTLKSEGNDFNQVLIKQEDLSDLPRCGNDLDENHTHHSESMNHSGHISHSGLDPESINTGTTKKGIIYLTPINEAPKMVPESNEANHERQTHHIDLPIL